MEVCQHLVLLRAIKGPGKGAGPCPPSPQKGEGGWHAAHLLHLPPLHEVGTNCWPCLGPSSHVMDGLAGGSSPPMDHQPLGLWTLIPDLPHVLLHPLQIKQAVKTFSLLKKVYKVFIIPTPDKYHKNSHKPVLQLSISYLNHEACRFIPPTRQEKNKLHIFGRCNQTINPSSTTLKHNVHTFLLT